MFFSKERELQRAQMRKRFLGGFLAILSMGIVYSAILTHQHSAWPTATGTVVKATIENPPEQTTRGLYRLYLTYDFTVNGQKYTGRDYQTQDRDQARLKHEQEDRFPVGANLTVWYDPQNPSQSDIKHSTDTMAAFFLVLAACAAFFAAKLLRGSPKAPVVPPEEY
ncbi:MAG TPA: DUF3592 domain-containing protein [Candidatus Obscuribacter sp.]|nr:DUF3592 domain-containing protein [Candidatus Obscuribacter sp.]HMY03175.1 DUF3592 domain-containing protein [Candidatus Obscuribacter sp.]HMY53241.1 DUF3592 domain-containing protein [Candidatus Obscuribacter sp.]HNB15456.1 DUF3592 domain-containing protein [Candidatus Obscuribacter sp.]HND06298.1 DUF3592 domain-containing protein [Candidatus Obscuribacter sp.]